MGRPKLSTSRQKPDSLPPSVKPARVVFMGQNLSEGFAADLLAKMITAMGLQSTEVRVIEPLSVAEFNEKFSEARPEILVILDQDAAEKMTGASLTTLRGVFSQHGTTQITGTLHPAHLIAHPEAKREVWMDLQRVSRELGIVLPPQKKS